MRDPWARGGLVSGGMQLQVRRIGQCVCGRCIYQIGNGPPEHVCTKAEVLARDWSALHTPVRTDDDG